MSVIGFTDYDKWKTTPPDAPECRCRECGEEICDCDDNDPDCDIDEGDGYVCAECWPRGKCDNCYEIYHTDDLLVASGVKTGYLCRECLKAMDKDDLRGVRLYDVVAWIEADHAIKDKSERANWRYQMHNTFLDALAILEPNTTPCARVLKRDLKKLLGLWVAEKGLRCAAE